MNHNEFVLDGHYIAKMNMGPIVKGEIYRCVKVPDGISEYAHLRGRFNTTWAGSLSHVDGDVASIHVMGWATAFTPHDVPIRAGGCHHEFVHVEFIGTETVIKNICRLCDFNGP